MLTESYVAGRLPGSDLRQSLVQRRSTLILLSAREARYVAFGSFLFAFVLFAPIFFDGSVSGAPISEWIRTGPYLRFAGPVPAELDRDVFLQLRFAAARTLSHYHQLPFWNPYKCGGMSLIGNPESAVVTPFILLYLVFGLAGGALLEIYLHIALMFAGGYVLGRELGLRPLACITLAGVFPSSSWLSLHIAAGHLNFLSLAYTPWALACLFASRRTKMWYPAILGGLFGGLTLIEGNYGLVFTVMLVGIVASVLAVGDSSFKPLVSAMIIVIFTVAFGALKLIPTAELLTLYPRNWGGSYIFWWSVGINLFSRYQDFTRPMTASFFFSEYGGYLSAPFVLLALIGAIGSWRKALPWLAGIPVFLLLYRGDIGSDALIVWLRLVPLGSNVGLCGRWVIPLVFCVGVLVALGVQTVCDRGESWGRPLAAILLIVGSIDVWLVCAPNYRYFFRPSFPAPAGNTAFRQYWNDSPGGLVDSNLHDLGAVNCGCCGYYIRPYDIVRGYNQPGYRGEFYLQGAGEANQIAWTPNRLTYEVDAPRPTSLIINQNSYPGWRIVRGEGELYSEGRLMAVKLPAGHQLLELVYRPTHILLAFVITATATLILIWAWMVERRNQPI